MTRTQIKDKILSYISTTGLRILQMASWFKNVQTLDAQNSLGFKVVIPTEKQT